MPAGAPRGEQLLSLEVEAWEDGLQTHLHYLSEGNGENTIYQVRCAI
jgi:hypothetical protein